MRRKIMTDAQIRKAHEYYMAEKYRTIAETAEAFDLNAFALRDSFARRELPTKRRGQRDPSTWARGKDHHRWEGGRKQDKDGYWRVYLEEDDPYFSMASPRDRYVYEHRYVMAQYLGRILEKWETVHHIDGNRNKNIITNLQLRIGQHGSGQAYCCSDCGSNRIEPVEV